MMVRELLNKIMQGAGGKRDFKLMSSRQQLLYIMQMTEDRPEDDQDAVMNDQWDQNNKSMKENYNQKFDRQRFELREKDLKAHPERWRMLAHALAEFNPIKRNKFLERQRYILHPNEFQQYHCACCSMADEMSSKLFGKAANSMDCGELCLNKSVNQDCLPQVCPVGKRCRNRRFTLNQNLFVYPVKTEKKGWGLCAGEFIKKDAFIMQYFGEVFNADSEIGLQRQELYKNSTCTYMMRTENNEVIDPTYYGNIARFINHSCDPNCVTRKWTVMNEVAIGIFARRDIQEDEELAFDYHFDSFKTPYTKCYCGTWNCKGYLGLASYEDENATDTAAVCEVCKKRVEEQSQLLLCKGACKSVFHIDCAAIKDKSIKEPGFKKSKYVCKMCFYLKTGRKKPGRKSKQEIAMYEEISKPQKTAPVNRPIEYDVEALKFLKNTTDNLIVDKMIHREIKQIDAKRKPQTGPNDITPYYYNFHTELAKRLKKRMRENRRKFRFRNKDEKLVRTEGRTRKTRKISSSESGEEDEDSGLSSVEDSQSDAEVQAQSNADESMESEVQYSALSDSEEKSEAASEESAESSSSLENIVMEEEAEQEVQEEDEDEEEEDLTSYDENEENKTIQQNKAVEQGPNEEITNKFVELLGAPKSENVTPIRRQRANTLVKAFKKTSLAKLKVQIKSKIEAFLQKELADEETQTEAPQCRVTYLNVYEDVFNLAIVENIDELECVPNLAIYWESPWASVVTAKITSTKFQFQTLLALMQDTLNQMHQNDYLFVPVQKYNHDQYLKLIGGAKKGFINNKGRSMVLPFMIMTIQVPKNLMRRLVGYREQTLANLKQRLKVKFTYETKWFTDFVYSMDDVTPMFVFGIGNDVLDACESLQSDLENLIMTTLTVAKEETKFFLDNIKAIKSWCDPCEIRVKKFAPPKDKMEIKHSFMYVPITAGEVCLIGNKQEIEYSQKKLTEYLGYVKSSPDVQRISQCFLLPAILKQNLRDIRDIILRTGQELNFAAYDPIYPRKHYSLIITGRWKEIMIAKSAMIKFIDRRLQQVKPFYRTYEEFQQYAVHKQLRFNFKILKRTQLEGTPRYLTFWDINSNLVQNVQREILKIDLKNRPSTPPQQKLEPAVIIKQQEPQVPILQKRYSQGQSSLAALALGQEQDSEPDDQQQSQQGFQMQKIQSQPQTQTPEINMQFGMRKSVTENPVVKAQSQIIDQEERSQIQIKQQELKELRKYLHTFDQETCINALFVLQQGAASQNQEQVPLPNNLARKISKEAQDVVNVEDDLPITTNISNTTCREKTSLQDLMHNLELEKTQVLHMMMNLILKTLIDLNFPKHQLFLYHKQKLKEKALTQLHQKLNTAKQNMENSRAAYENAYHDKNKQFAPPIRFENHSESSQSRGNSRFKTAYGRDSSKNRDNQDWFRYQEPYNTDYGPPQYQRNYGLDNFNQRDFYDNKFKPNKIDHFHQPNRQEFSRPMNYSYISDNQSNKNSELPQDHSLQLQKSKSVIVERKVTEVKIEKKLTRQESYQEEIKNDTYLVPNKKPRFQYSYTQRISPQRGSPGRKFYPVERDHHRDKMRPDNQSDRYSQNNSQKSTKNQNKPPIQIEKQNSQRQPEQLELRDEKSTAKKYRSRSRSKETYNKKSDSEYSYSQNQQKPQQPNLPKRWHPADPAQPSGPPSAMSSANVIINGNKDKNGESQQQLVIVRRDAPPVILDKNQELQKIVDSFQSSSTLKKKPDNIPIPEVSVPSKLELPLILQPRDDQSFQQETDKKDNKVQEKPQTPSSVFLESENSNKDIQSKEGSANENSGRDSSFKEQPRKKSTERHFDYKKQFRNSHKSPSPSKQKQSPKTSPKKPSVYNKYSNQKSGGSSQKEKYYPSKHQNPYFKPKYDKFNKYKDKQEHYKDKQDYYKDRQDKDYYKTKQDSTQKPKEYNKSEFKDQKKTYVSNNYKGSNPVYKMDFGKQKGGTTTPPKNLPKKPSYPVKQANNKKPYQRDKHYYEKDPQYRDSHYQSNKDKPHSSVQKNDKPKQ